jgi:hypothetical protein
MKKIFFGFNVVAISLIAAMNSLSQEQVIAPIHKDGDSWQFNVREWDRITQGSDELDGVYELSYRGGKIEIFQGSGDQKKILDKQPDALLALLGSSKSQRFEHDLKFPFSIGKKWTSEYRTTISGIRGSDSRSVEVRVLGLEDVTTAAGKFSAFKLQKEDWGRFPCRWVTTYFYSPQTNSIVKSSYNGAVGEQCSGKGLKREIELIKFGSAG